MKFTRRRFLVTAIAGAAGGLGALIGPARRRPGYLWHGAALGGEARVALYGAGKATGAAALNAAADEIERLEDIFSLHRPDSELSRLNAHGSIMAPSRDLIEVVRKSLEWRERTEGAFNPLVQPLWLAAAHGGTVTAELLSLVKSHVEIRSDTIRLAAGAQLTLNGIAQGHIADRVAMVLGMHGYSDVVIDAGELRLPGKTRRAVGIPAINAAVWVGEVAIATSEPKSLVFDAKSFRHHLLEPETGRSPHHWNSISVFASTAETADALSTGFAVVRHDTVAELVRKIGNVAVIGADSSGRVRIFGDVRLTGRQS